jgi:RHS repeat-associated protein
MLAGRVIAILDADGNVVVSYMYDAWGAPLWCTGELEETLGKVQPFRYRGYVFDEETGLYYLRSRYYNPCVQRFVNADIFPNLSAYGGQHIAQRKRCPREKDTAFANYFIAFVYFLILFTTHMPEIFMHFSDLTKTLYRTKVLVPSNCLYNSTNIHVFHPNLAQFFRNTYSFCPESGQNRPFVRGSRTLRKRGLTLVC